MLYQGKAFIGIPKKKTISIVLGGMVLAMLLAGVTMIFLAM